MKKSLLILLLLTPSACRFGNYSEPPKNNNTSIYSTIQLYLTEPSQLQTVVIYNDATPTSSNSNAPLAAIPSSVMNVFTDPVYYAVPTDTKQLPLFADINQSHSLSTAVDKNGVIKYEYDSSIVTLWKNPKCVTQVQMFQEGSFDKTHGAGTVLTFPDGSTSKTAGRLNLTFTYLRVIDGGATQECSQDLQYLAQCYQTGTGCTSDELKSANALFDLYVNRGGVLKIEDVTKIKALAYIVHFQ